MGVRAARLAATAVLPTPVGPTRTGVRCRVSGPTKPTFQFLFRQLHHAWPAVHVVRRQRRGEQPDNELAHLARVERLTGLDGGAAGVSRRKALEPVLPASEAAAGEIGHQLLQAARRLEPGMRIRRGVHDDAAAGERLDLEPDAGE